MIHTAGISFNDSVVFQITEKPPVIARLSHHRRSSKSKSASASATYPLRAITAMILIHFADVPGELTAKCSLISGQFTVMISQRFVNWNARLVLNEEIIIELSSSISLIRGTGRW
jgi:hypothetical protein